MPTKLSTSNYWAIVRSIKEFALRHYGCHGSRRRGTNRILLLVADGNWNEFSTQSCKLIHKVPAFGTSQHNIIHSMNSGLLAFIIKELKEMLPPTVFFAVGFNLIVLTTNLLLADYLATFGSFIVATTTALVVGKAVLVAHTIPFLRRFDMAPLIQPILLRPPSTGRSSLWCGFWKNSSNT